MSITQKGVRKGGTAAETENAVYFFLKTASVVDLTVGCINEQPKAE